MQILIPPLELPVEARGAVLALGNFDGVHLGHQSVLLAAKQIAQEAAAPLAVLSFEPHPRRFFQQDMPPFRLTQTSQKAELLAHYGVDYFFLTPFNAELAKTSATMFVSQYIKGWAHARHVVAGDDFHFGCDRQGSMAFLQQHFGAATAVPPALDEWGDVISSSRVRMALQAGDLEKANKLLGHAYTIAGIVTHGDKRGRLLGFPTANIALSDYQRPAYGVYAAYVFWKGLKHKAVANIGVRPTVNGREERFEVHLIDFDGDLYGETLSVELIAFIRPEQKMPSLDALKAQISRDVQVASGLL